MKYRVNKNLINFYKNKKIFITGHSGFKGSWLTFILKMFGAKVYGYSLSPSKKISNFYLLNLNKNIQNNFFFDIRNKKKLISALKKTKPEIIFHLAAQSLVKKSYKDPIETFETNINGTLNLLEGAHKLTSIKSIVIITSDKCYKNIEKNSGYKETDELGGYDPYSASKAAVENVFYAYYNAKFKNKKNIGVVSARAGNVIGGGDWSDDRIIPDFIKAISKKKKKFQIRSPKAERPWQHILDLINGYLILGKKAYGNKKFDGSWNFGPKSIKTKNVMEIVNYLRSSLNQSIKIEIKKNKKLKETNLLFLDSNKSQNYLKWEPKYNIKESLNLTAEWYKEFLTKKSIIKISSNQIKKFYDL